MTMINYIGLLVIVFFVGATTGIMAYAETIQITDNPDFETSPVLGQDNIGKYMVYTSHSIDSGNLGDGEIFLQRLDVNNNPIGSPINISQPFDANNVLPDAFGDYIVFTALDKSGDGTGQIILHQISTRQNTIIDSGMLREAKIHGENITWIKGLPGETTVKLNTISDIMAGNTFKIIGGPMPPAANPEIGDRFVVWETALPENFNVAAYDLVLDKTFDVFEDPIHYQYNPTTGGSWIVSSILDVNFADESYLILKNMDTNEIISFDSGGFAFQNPSIHDNVIVYDSNENGKLDVYAYNILDGFTEQITFDENHQFFPHILDSVIVYVSQYDPTTFDLYLSTITFDKDDDGIEDKSDNCIDTVNPKQLDDDGDGIGNVCDGIPIGNLVFDGNPKPTTFASEPIEFQFGEPITASLNLSALEPRSGTVWISLLAENNDGSRTVIDYCEKSGVSLDTEESVFFSCTFPNILDNIPLGRYGISYSMFGPGSTSIGLPIIVVQLIDSDNDGIEDIIDPLPFDSNNNSFDDGTTSGTIVRGDQILTVTDSVDPNGVKVVSDENSGLTPATITDCEGTTYTITAGDEVIITCGSSIIEVIKGPIEAKYDIDGDSVTATLITGDSITFEQDDLSFTNTGETPVIILVNGNEITIESGETLKVNLTIPIQIDIIQDSYNCNSNGSVPIAILASGTFNPLQIDLDTITVNGIQVSEKHEKIHAQDVNDDGLDDAVLHIDNFDETLSIPDGECVQIGQVFVPVGASLNDGTPVEGGDDVILKGKKIKEN